MNEPEDHFGSDAAQTSVEGDILDVVHEAVIKVWKLWENCKAHISPEMCQRHLSALIRNGSKPSRVSTMA